MKNTIFLEVVLFKSQTLEVTQDFFQSEACITGGREGLAYRVPSVDFHLMRKSFS